ncbi:MAG: SDR family NAD(P)-dependent oxidoreductase [Propioniciclava sp.]
MNPLDLTTSLTGRSVVVTGASGGIGSRIVMALATSGTQVVGVDLPGHPIPEHEGITPVAADLTDLATHAGLFGQAAARAPLVGLVHTAAIIRRTEIDLVTEAEFDAQVAVNLKASYFLNREAWRALRGHGGSIVNYISQGWMTGGYQGSTVYAATKGALASMTRGFARSFAPDQVRVNAVSPGFIDTEMMHAGISAHDRDQITTQVPLGRLGQPEELVGATTFLLSDAASYITGAVINVSGGQLMY